MRIAALLGLVTMLAWVNRCQAETVERIENSRFAQPIVSSTETFYAPSSLIPGWDVTAGSVDLIPADTWILSQQLLDLVGDEPGMIEQTIKTVPGGIYRLSINYANHPDTLQVVSGRVQVFSTNSVFVEQQIDYSGWTGEDGLFGVLRHEFIADDQQATFRFAALNQDNGHGLLLRSVFLSRFVLGDMNCDDAVNLLDVTPWIQCVTNCSYNEAADINMDGSVDLLDVEPFIELLLNSNQ